MKTVLVVGLIFLLYPSYWCNAQGFAPLAPGGVIFNKASHPVEGVYRLILSIPNGPDNEPLGGYAYQFDQKKKWVNPILYGKENLFAENNGIIGRTYNGQMILVSYEELTKRVTVTRVTTLIGPSRKLCLGSFAVLFFNIKLYLT